MDRQRVLGMFGAALLVLLGVRGDASDGKVKPASSCCCGTACCCGDACGDLCCTSSACCRDTCDCCGSGDAASSMKGKVVS